jgi:RNA polymerase primary sigma factor
MPRSRKQPLPPPRLAARDTSLDIYLRDIASNRPLTTQEEATLMVSIRGGDRSALEQLVLANLRFVVSVSHAYEHQGLPLADLINEGNLGLIRAVHRFDEKKNFRFISYAVWWIRQAILHALARQSRITHLPLNRAGTLYQIGRSRRVLEQHLHRQPSAEEIAADLRMKPAEVNRMVQVGGRHSSMDAAGESGTLHDQLASEELENVDERLFDSAMSQELHRVLETLSSKECRIVKLYFGVGYDTTHTLDEIGSQLGLTRERVRQIKEQAFRKLALAPGLEGLRPFLGRD